VSKQKQHNSGFSAVTIIVAIVIIALGGTAGWLVYQNYHQPKAAVTSTIHKPTPDPTKNWTAFSSTLGKFSLRYPNTWVQPTQAVNCQGTLGDSILFLSPEILPGTSCDSQMYVDANAGNKVADETPTNDSGYANIMTVPVTVDSVTGTRSTATVAQGHPGHEYIPGSKIIQYVFFTNDMTYRLQYLQNPADSKGFTQDVSRDFDLMATKTLSFKTPTTQTNNAYLYIPEWDIKIKLGSADPSIVEYKLSSTADGGALGKLQGEVSLSLKDSITTDQNCKSLGIAIYRQAVSDQSSESANAKKVGNYVYGVTGSPHSCDSSRLNAIRTQYTGNNPAGWEYLGIN
jgi:hypothetical protein